MPPGQKPLVLITHDESTFNANDGKRRLWAESGKQPLRPKSKGKGIMVSGFLTPGGILRIPDTISDAELLADSSWPKDEAGNPEREAIRYLEYGKDNYWTGEKMVRHTKDVIPFLRYAFPGCEGLFAFDNASNHCVFAPDALVASKMNLGYGRKQPLMREGWDHARRLPQSMIYPENHPDTARRGKAKGVKAVLQERKLWPAQGRGRRNFVLRCKAKKKTKTEPDQFRCDPALEGRCCATSLLQSQPDFQAQKGQLQEEVEAAGHSVIFYPKFHCELNFIERFWCAAKYYTRENCLYTIESLRTTIPAAFRSITSASINKFYHHCVRAIEAYAGGFTYGTKSFQDQVHKNHRQVPDPSKW